MATGGNYMDALDQHISNIGLATSPVLFEEVFLTSIARGDSATVNFYMEYEIDSQIIKRAIEMAASYGRMEYIPLLVGDIDDFENLRMAIESAAFRGHHEVVSYLLKKVHGYPYSGPLKDCCLTRTLKYAAKACDVPTVLLLLSGHYLLLLNPLNALLSAVHGGNIKVLELILKASIDIAEKNDVDLVAAMSSALDEAARKNNIDAIKVLSKNKQVVEHNNNNALNIASNNGHFEAVLELMLKGMIEDEKSLKLAARAGHKKIVDLFFTCFRLFRPESPDYKEMALASAKSRLDNDEMIEFLSSQMQDLTFTDTQKT